MFVRKEFSKNKTKVILTELEKIRKSGTGSIVYMFADGSKLRQAINPKIFKTDRDSYTPLTEIILIFNTIKEDLGAKDYLVNN